MMDDPTSTKVPTQAAAPDDGWCLEKRSWAFHRSVWRKLGKRLEFGEYGFIRKQITSGEAELLRFGSRQEFYRVRLRDNTVVEIMAIKYPAKKPWYDLRQFIKVVPQSRQFVPAPAPLPVSFVAPPIAEVPEPPPAPPPRSNVLTLGAKSPTAADILAARLRPKPLPPRIIEPAPQIQMKARSKARG